MGFDLGLDLRLVVLDVTLDLGLVSLDLGHYLRIEVLDLALEMGLVDLYLKLCRV